MGACVGCLRWVLALGARVRSHVYVLTNSNICISAHLRLQLAWICSHNTFCAICLHSALFVCTKLIFKALRSVYRCNKPTLLSTLPALLPTLPARVATKPNSIGDAFAGHRESRFSVTPTSFTPSLYPHSVPAQHIICLYMQDNADEVQVVQAVQTKVQAVQTKVQIHCTYIHCVTH